VYIFLSLFNIFAFYYVMVLSVMVNKRWLFANLLRTGKGITRLVKFFSALSQWQVRLRRSMARSERRSCW